MEEESRKETILVVDDTPSTIEVVKTALEEEGYEVIVATSGDKALKRAERAMPALILLDVRMPGMDGFETCRRLKANECTSAIPVIFMTGVTATDSKITGFEAGGVDYVTKPIEIGEILARVKTHLSLQRLRTELEQKNASLEAANKMLEEFAYVVSHDLKAPLRGIAQLAHWLVEDYASAFDQEGKEKLDLLFNRVKYMESLIDGILRYSRVGRIAEAKEPIDLHHFVNGVIKLIAPPESIQITIEKELPHITGDSLRIQEVFQNLLSNAIKFMDKPDGRITIGCVDEGTHWIFRVADNGPGIPPECYEDIFHIFRTSMPRDDYESTGIGLALVKKIVEWYGGRIWVESEPGKGSTFFFTFPKAS